MVTADVELMLHIWRGQSRRGSESRLEGGADEEKISVNIQERQTEENQRRKNV